MSPPRIVVTGPIPEAALEVLRCVGELVMAGEDGQLSPDALRAAVSGADAVVTLLYDRVDQAMLDSAGVQLRIVANVAVGFDNIDVDACHRRGVVVTNTPGVLVDATADLTIGLLLALTRRVVEGDRLVRSGAGWRWSMSFMLGAGLQGRRLGLVGFGRIGQAVAHRAEAFGMDVVFTRRSRQGAPAGTTARPAPLDELLRTADVVSLHCPLTPETHHLIDAAALAAMRPSAYLINTARGPVVDEAALARALGDGSVAGAALDVFEREPAVEADLLDSPRVVLTPHLGSATVETRQAMAVLAARNVVEILAGRPALTPVLGGTG